MVKRSTRLATNLCADTSGFGSGCQSIVSAGTCTVDACGASVQIDMQEGVDCGGYHHTPSMTAVLLGGQIYPGCCIQLAA
ncbi:hypothetical protein NEOLEDRAFT_1075795 [Neolentinus lepideus HHB14362 ss-1]|uniref:Uncharacterized protein n=1 Tax=Neolentinus lepideus HHB14362 ss-1 TaxID=1314782 RepID=A0A165P0X6_9AGAM|nr:hypothetical protein NEOLEDRAFT_1075795 [Neolentinus lepideus HHB14362 ss-1]